jgi:hypothetical protein
MVLIVVVIPAKSTAVSVPIRLKPKKHQAERVSK